MTTKKPTPPIKPSDITLFDLWRSLTIPQFVVLVATVLSLVGGAYGVGNKLSSLESSQKVDALNAKAEDLTRTIAKQQEANAESEARVEQYKAQEVIVRKWNRYELEKAKSGPFPSKELPGGVTQVFNEKEVAESLKQLKETIEHWEKKRAKNGTPLIEVTGGREKSGLIKFLCDQTTLTVPQEAIPPVIVVPDKNPRQDTL